MQSIILSVFAIGTVLGSGAAVVQHAYDVQPNNAAAISQTISTVDSETQKVDMCQPVRFRLYFPKGSAEINPAGRILISRAIDNVSDCENVSILIGAPDPQLESKTQRAEASERGAALLAELEAIGLNGDIYVAREDDVLSGPGVYMEPRSASTPEYIAVSIQPSNSQPMADSEVPSVKT